MYTCRKCDCNYDAGELIGGICIDCLEKQRERTKRENDIRQMLCQPAYQMMLDLKGFYTVKSLK